MSIHNRPSRRREKNSVHALKESSTVHADPMVRNGIRWEVTHDRFGNVAVGREGDPLGEKYPKDSIYFQGEEADQFRNMSDEQILDYVDSSGVLPKLSYARESES